MNMFVRVLLIVVGYIVWQFLELRRFRVTDYRIKSDKVSGDLTMVVLSDLHGFNYGKNNKKLVERIRQCRPMVVLIVGDLISAKKPDTYGTALALLKELREIAPVFYCFGNHESFNAVTCALSVESFNDYVDRAKGLGVVFLHNENRLVRIGDITCAIGGCQIDHAFYEKGKDTPMEPGYVKELMGAAKEDSLQILLAHHPAYAPRYTEWGADLTFCGHNHGGLVYLPGVGSLLSPQLTLFPKYNAGQYTINGKRVIVSRGLGTHTFHIRIFNRAEVVFVSVKPG
jgi:predicted MPP superfamily phosphohydrolase